MTWDIDVIYFVCHLTVFGTFELQKFGNYEADKSLSTADWVSRYQKSFFHSFNVHIVISNLFLFQDEISTLNASISEAESFELVVDEESRKEVYCINSEFSYKSQFIQ